MTSPLKAYAHHNNVNLLRALAVIAVWVQHLHHYIQIPLPYLGDVGGQFGVQLFFLVSGYLVVQSAARYAGWAFLLNRAFRIFPTYWSAVLMFSFWPQSVLANADWSDWPSFLANWFTLSHVFPYALGRFDVLHVSWTLTVEWSWYFLVIGLLWGMRRAVHDPQHQRRFWLSVFVASVAISALWVQWASLGVFDAWYSPGILQLGLPGISPALRTAFIEVAAPAQWMFFLLGVLLHYWRQVLSQTPSLVLLLVTVLLLAQPAWWMQVLGVDPNLMTGLGLAALFVIVERFPANWSRHLVCRCLHWLGDISYPIYLIHVAVIFAIDAAGLRGWQALLPNIFLTLTLAALLHYQVENPGRRWGSRLLSSRAQPLDCHPC